MNLNFHTHFLGQSKPSATNVFYPSAFTDVDLMEAKITAGNFSSVNEMEVRFMLTSTAMAPYVYLHTDVNGYFRCEKKMLSFLA